jgi:hypothetical protein
MMATKTFPGLNAYGNYTAETLPKRGVCRIPMDGTIRTVRALGLPHVEIVDIVNAYGKHWFPQRVGYAILSRDQRKLKAALEKKKMKVLESRVPKPHPDLLLCIREASRAAHRERDAAQVAYQAGRHTLAGNCKDRKNHWYRLKDRGIVTAHRQGLLRYVGASPQGMAIYEYGDGGRSCFHSTLHPAGIERTPVENHPEILMVEAKDKIKGISLNRVKVTLLALPDDFSGYERSASPAMKKSAALVCWSCGEEGHTSRNCPLAYEQVEEVHPA